MTIKLIRYHILMFVGVMLLNVGRGFMYVARHCFHAAATLYTGNMRIK